MIPKYSVGEKVLLRSDKWPHFNDVYHISKVVPKETLQVCDLTGRTYLSDSSGVGYVLVELKETTRKGFEYIWKESSLRKFHDPSGDSFEEMMEKLKKANVEEFV